MAATMLRSVVGTPRISTMPFTACYMNIDWAWLAPRHLAAVAFGIAISDQSDCEWHQCIVRADGHQPWTQWPTYPRRVCTGATDDTLLSMWWLSHGVPFDVMMTEVPAAQRGLALNRACTYTSQGWIDLISPDKLPPENRHVAGCRREFYSHFVGERRHARSRQSTWRERAPGPLGGSRVPGSP